MLIFRKEIIMFIVYHDNDVVDNENDVDDGNDADDENSP